MARGLAAAAVMVAHATLLGQNPISPVVSDVPSLLSHLGSTAVWLFFVISGFVVSRPFVRALLTGSAAPAIGRYGIKRIARIYPLYWACVVVVVATVGWAGAGPISKLAHVLLLHNAVPGRQQAFIPVSWTLTLEVLFYAAVPAGAFLVRSFSRGDHVGPDRLVAWLLTGWIVAATYLAVVPLLIQDPTRQLWMRGSFPAMAGMFVPGVLLAVATESEAGSRTARAWAWLRGHPSLLTGGALAGCALGAVLASVDITADATSRLALWDLSRHAYAVGYGSLIARLAIAPTWSFAGVGALRRLGDASYGVYLIHGTVLLVVLANPSVIPLARPGIVSFVVHAVLLSAITVPLSLLSWRWFERPVSDRARAGRAVSTPTGPVGAPAG